MPILNDELASYQSTAIAAAQLYASFGWRVVPLHGIADGVCRCGRGADCPDPGKHPRLKDWPNEASANEDKIAEWLDRWPDGNIGVRLGEASGIVDVEFDTDEGRATADRLLGDCFTPTYKSHRSTHRLFAFPADLAIPKAVVTIDGLELRFGTGSKAAQSVMPPSRHAAGLIYSWLPGLSPEEVEPMAFPVALAELLGSSSNGPALVMQAEEPSLSEHPGAAEGERHSTLCRLVGRYLNQHGADADLLPQALAWGERCRPTFPADEVGKVVAGLAAQEMEKRGASAEALQTRQDKATAQPLRIRPLSSVKVEPVEWLWERRFPLGRLSLVAGSGDVGKTTMLCAVASMLSRGQPLPGERKPVQCETLFITAEDGADTIRGRVETMDGDIDRVHTLAEGVDLSTFCDSAAGLRVTLEQNRNIRLVVFDTLPDFVGGIDEWRNNAVRQALRPLITIASDLGVAIVGICHFRKGTDGNAGDKLLGSVAYRNLSRSILFVLKDIENEGHCIVYQEKHNLSLKASTLRFGFQITGCDFASIVWDRQPVDIADITPYLASKGGSQGKLDAAKEWLRNRLSEGPKQSAEIRAAAEAADIKQPTLYRAKDTLKVIAEQGIWRLPPPDSQEQFSNSLVLENENNSETKATYRF